MQLVDSHCHLDDDRFDDTRDEVVEDAAGHGVTRMVVPATTANRWEKIKRLCDSNSGLHAAYGLHPMFIEQHQAAHIAELDEWLDKEKPVAVGECGVDFFQGRRDEAWQWKLFNEQLQLAKNHQLPVIVHVRKGMDQVLKTLRQTRVKAGVIHSFSGSLQQAEQLVELNFKIGIAATVSFERARKLRDVVSRIDQTALLLESDAPDQPGPKYRNQLNEPSYIREHLKIMADLRHITVTELAIQLSTNSRELFGFQQ